MNTEQKVDANQLGFLPTNHGDDNTIALQAAVSKGGTIYISQPGTYDMSGTITLCSNTTLIFGKDVIIRRSLNKDGLHVGSHFFINEGAYTRTYDENITLIGLHICCNKYESAKNTKIVGLRGQVSFFYIKNLVIQDFTCMDLGGFSFCIQVCTFENLLVEDVHIEGRKDGVHLGKGKNFIIRNGMFRTYDDPIAINAHDYTTGNPQLGWIENGLIDNCYDLNDDSTVGFFCRVLAGCWVEWFPGMEVKLSDSVLYNQKLYRVDARVHGESYISNTPPTHDSGSALVDGICWVMIQDDAPVYDCGCRNIHFQNIHLQKVRDIAFSLHFDNDNYSHSIYPNAILPVQENITLENIYVENKINSLFSITTPIDLLKITDSQLGNTTIDFKPYFLESSPVVGSLILENNTYGETGVPTVTVGKGRTVHIQNQ